MVAVNAQTLTKDSCIDDTLISRVLVHLQTFRNVDLFSRGYALRQCGFSTATIYFTGSILAQP
jgi:hypothetical protein